MKKSFIIGGAFLASVLVGCNSKTETPNAVAEAAKGGQVIAYVDIDTLEEKSEYFKEFKTALEKSKSDKESAIQREAEVFQRELAEFQQKAQYMTQTEGEAAQQRLMNKKDALERKAQQMQESLLAETTKFNEQWKAKLDSFFVEYNADKRYSYILPYQSGSILYKDTTFDITAEVLKALNEKYPATKK